MLTRLKILLLATLLLISMGQAAEAALSAVSPALDPTGVYPAWYQDTTGLALEPCLLNNGLCVLLADASFNPALPVVAFTNFPEEMFYFIADSTMSVGPSLEGKAVYRAALEGAFLAAPAAGQQIVFLRINLKKTSGLTPNSTFTVTHPYGTFQFTSDATGNTTGGAQAFRAEEGCFGPPCDFALPLPAVTTNIGPFLKAVSPAPPLGYIGDPAINQTVTGSPFGTNIFRIDGPNIGGPGVNTIQTNLFNLAGKTIEALLPTPLVVDRTTYSRSVSGQVEVFAASAPTATLTVSGGLNLPAGDIPMTGDPAGNFFARIPLVDAGTLPPFVTVNAANAGQTPTTLTGNLTDLVTITTADYSVSNSTLTIAANSSDKSVTAPPTLTVAGLGAMTNGVLVVSGVTVPVPTVTVSSSAGGLTTAKVNILTTSISGTVREGLTPVAGVTITLSGTAAASVTTAADGTYSFSGLINGLYTLTPAKAGFVFGPTNIKVTYAGTSLSAQDFIANRVFSISGTVTLGTAPLPGVVISLSGGATGFVTTAVNGTYSFTGLTTGNYTLTPGRAGFIFAPASATIALNADAPGQDFAATQLFSISGTVTSGTTPISGVTITLGGASTGSTTTAADGTYSFTGLAGGGTYTLTPGRAGSTFTPVSSSVVLNANANGQNFTGSETIIIIPVVSSISGKVTALGLPVSGVTVTLGGASTASVTTDIDGAYTFTGLANGPYTVTPSSAGFVFTPAAGNILLNNADVANVNFARTPAGTTFLISGKVTDNRGIALSGVQMTLSGATTGSTVTDTAGNYTFTGVVNGVYTVSPSPASSYKPVSQSVTINNSNRTGQNFKRNF